MNTRQLVFIRKSMTDFSAPITLSTFLVGYGLILFFVATGMTNSAPDDLATLTLYTQEQWLIGVFGQLSFVWAVGLPVMAFVTVLSARGIAAESENGTLEILLSKPVARRQVLLGKFLAIYIFTFLTMVASLLLTAAVVFSLSGASPAAIGGSIFHLLPGNLVYALFVSFFLAAFGTVAAVATGTRLRTALAILVLPALFFAFLFLRLLPFEGLYEDYYLYLIDPSYHLGNAFVFLHELTGSEFTPETKASLDAVTGVYDSAGITIDPLVGGMSTGVPLAGYVPPLVSTIGVIGLSIGLLAIAIVRFQRMDVQ